MKRNRIAIDLSNNEFVAALEEIREATGRPSKSDVVRDALELYDLVIQQLKEGKHIYIGKTRETAGEVLLPHLELAARRGQKFIRVVKDDDSKK
jgi:Arc/MetJ-type ribon-helix-helix transcriptional regulator